MRDIRALLAGAATALALSAGMAGTASAEIVLHRGNTSKVETLDQHRTSTVYESNILQDLYEGLVAHDAAAQVVPGTAESWTISDDGTVYTFTIREDARWSNGDPVTAEDFAFSFRRIMDPATGAKYANILYPIKNAEAVNKGELPPEELGVRAIDDRTLEITLEQPTPYFLELLTHQTGLPVHAASVREHGDDFVRPENIVTNGAYMVEEHILNQHLKAVKNPHYWDAENVQIDTVYFYPTEDRSAALRAFRAGELHINNDAPVDQVEWMRENLGDQFETSPYLGTYYYALNTSKPPFDDVRVRQALSMAIDREYLAEEILQAGQLPAYTLVPPGINNYVDESEIPVPEWASLSMFEREDQAIALLEEAGYGPDSPIDLTISYNTSEQHEQVAVAIADMWAPLGVNVELFNTDVATHYAHLRDKGDYDVARAAWIVDYSDPQNFLFLLESDNDGFNYANYNNPEYDALMDKAAATVDLEERAQILRQAEEIFVRDTPYIPIYFYVNLNLVSDQVEGWVLNAQNRHRTKYLRLTQS